ncbi:hypothetical protein [Geomesophilobacter sediminis]|uniref:Uncharacterized protein n=1 Tax=Geomesophilobacter sediminis TaxID=2798584 RepID=A0A8J7JBM6_9BACT|nr:hypothetical protein [Geomesophilobacter sediminis]MBJ6724581.1 hypothetical protein [Geomesophilobacter sediminis]
MADIEIEIRDDTLLLAVSGVVHVADVIAAIEKYYPLVTKHVIWDVTHADLNQAVPDEFRQVFPLVKRYRRPSPGARTAYVARREKDYALARMFSILVQLEEVSSDIQVFYTLKEAEEYIRQGGD